ncbi:hypothetical protein RB653_006739 [Dictyostelium firmibasis]|uniref:Lipocalin/cytosolic fatty-acid binding domain-containing protein n=1 Tax=Dictyostelium firmibasis TaxID=79012 RepID=A0AAN7TTH6_9MYCE
MEILMGAAVLGGVTYIYKSFKRYIPEGVHAVKPFYPEKYVGKWYEIARLENYFEKDMNNILAEYSTNEDGSIKVVNSGYNYKKKKRESVTGKAYFVNGQDVGMLKVSFFGPFYSGYNVIAIDSDYKYALIAGQNFSYMWILSKEPTIPDEIKKSYLELAKSVGYDINKLIWTEHNGN